MRKCYRVRGDESVLPNELLLIDVAGTPILLVDFLNTTVARMTSRAFVGSPLCQENDWLGMVGEHPRHMFSVSTSLKIWPSYLRPFVAPHLQAKKKLNEFRGRLQQKLSPLIEHRRAMKELPKAQRPVDMLQWLVDNCKGYEAKDDNIVSKLLFLNLAAIGTTTATLEQIFVELCQRREYIEILREEVNSVLGLEGGLNLSVLKRLTKMDSFMKETVRINPLGYCKTPASARQMNPMLLHVNQLTKLSWFHTRSHAINGTLRWSEDPPRRSYQSSHWSYRAR